MKEKYAFVGGFNNGYAFVRSYTEFNNKGLIDSNGVEVIPPEYFAIVGQVSDNFLIGVCQHMTKYYRTVDWDNECEGPDYVYDGYIYYLLDKAGHKFRLDIDSRCDVTYESGYSDGGSHFTFKYQRNSNSNYYDVFESYTFFPGEEFVLISSCDKKYIQYFNGKRKEISYDELEGYTKQSKQLVLKK